MKISIFKASGSRSEWIDTRNVFDSELAPYIFQAALDDGTITSEGTYVLLCTVTAGFSPDTYPYVFEVEAIKAPKFRIKTRS